MKNIYLAIDIGASGGRHIAGWFDDEKIHLKEVYRFSNAPVWVNKRLHWNHERLFDEIIKGLKACSVLGMHPQFTAIDTWGVDYALVNRQGQLTGPIFCYRDERTQGLDQTLDEQWLYEKTGIQRQPFNTIYQLLATGRDDPLALDQAQQMLMLPEYFNYRLTGNKVAEYTNATTTGLVNAASRQWDQQIINKTGLPPQLFSPLMQPGTLVGSVKNTIAKEIGFSTNILLAPSHDTACAVAAAPIRQNSLYLSSGTWSLMGAEITRPITSSESLRHNITNEGGVAGTYRYLKNIMGLWILQCLKKEAQKPVTYQEMAALAQMEPESETFIDVNNPDFLAPKHMGQAIDAYLKGLGRPPVKKAPQGWRLIFDSLAKDYQKTANEITALTGTSYQHIAIVGGGSQNQLLNQLTANACNKTVTAGPVEATAIGNLLSQMVATKEIPSYAYGRVLIQNSFNISTYYPTYNQFTKGGT